MEDKTDDTEFETKYPGGKSGSLAWESAVEERTFNQPIFKALWENDKEKLDRLKDIPTWEQGWNIDKKKEEWTKICKYAKEFFPIVFCSKTKGQQQSMASIFEALVDNKRTMWWRILRGSTCDAALIHVRRLRPENVGKVRQELKELQGNEQAIDHTLLENALNDVIMFVPEKHTELEDTELTIEHCRTKYTDQDNPREWFRGIEELHRRLIKHYEENGTDYSSSSLVDWDQIAKRMIEGLPSLYLPAIMNIEVSLESVNLIYADSGSKIVSADGSSKSVVDDAGRLEISYDHLKKTVCKIYDRLRVLWNKDGRNIGSNLPAFNQVTVEYAKSIDDCWKACWDCGMIGMDKYTEHGCKNPGSGKYYPHNSDNPFANESTGSPYRGTARKGSKGKGKGGNGNRNRWKGNKGRGKGGRKNGGRGAGAGYGNSPGWQNKRKKNQEQDICAYFIAPGGCRKGKYCKWLHPVPWCSWWFLVR